MPTLPLYDPAPPHPDGWHRVTAPGGYETWHFDAEDAAGGVRIIATFSEGSPFDGEYRRRYTAFLAKPTTLTPPQPAEYPSVSFVLWEKGRTVARFAYRYPADAFDASRSGLELHVGPHRVLPGTDGTMAMTIGDVAIDGGAARLSAELWFTPRFAVAPFERRFPTRDMSGADHFWVIANPLCAVSGIIRIAGASNLPPQELHFAGRGYHDHRYGTAPIFRAGNVGWVRGRALFEDGAEPFQYEVGGAAQSYLRADASGIHEVAPTLSLDSPLEIDLNPFAVTRAYEAVRDGRWVGTALCESARHGFSFPPREGDFVDAPRAGTGG